MEILGIDIGGSGMKGAMVDVNTGELTTERYRLQTPQPATPEKMARVVQRLAKRFDWSGPVGCAFPARVKNGVATTASNIDKSCIGDNLAERFSEKIGEPVYIVNDADAAGIAEMSFGAGVGRTDLVLVLTVGTGIGSALFVDRILVANTELGHINVKGRNGEKYASDAARKRRELDWRDWAKRFQHYLNRIEFLIGPDLIILGGGISNPKKRDNYFKKLRTNADLVTAELGNRAGIVGAAMFAANSLAGLHAIPMLELPQR